jgi:m7GpppX diphosphatase
MELLKKENNRTSFINTNEQKIVVCETRGIIDISRIDDLHLVSQNTKYSKYIGRSMANIELLEICPYDSSDKIKYGNELVSIIDETVDDYLNIYHKIFKLDKMWIMKILNDGAEADKIIYEDFDFILMLDITMHSINNANSNINNMHYLAIIKRTDILSLRDLDESHIALLEHIDTTGKEIIYKIIGTDNPYIKQMHIRSYVHYRPTFWHLHIHFDLTGTNNSFANMDYCHLIHNIIQNIKLCSNYYQKATLRVCAKKIL